MASFYYPYTFRIGTTPIILYPYVGIESIFDRTDSECLEDYIQELYEANRELVDTGLYHIIILWNEGEHKMADVWIFDEFESEDAGSMITVVNFQDYQEDSSNGVTASDGLIMLGRETELAESLRKSGRNIQEYISGERPTLPDDSAPIEEFYR